MCRFIETLCLRWGEVQHLKYHQQRVNRSRREVLGLNDALALEGALQVPAYARQVERVKCRLLYSATVEDVSFSEYQPRSIRSLRIVRHDTIRYAHKFANRDLIHQLFALRGDCDDILIVKQGLITDTSYSNVAFYDGQQWVTPQLPLLEGTCRSRLLDEGRLIEKEITPGDLSRFSHVSLINAMLPVGEVLLPTAQIYGAVSAPR